MDYLLNPDSMYLLEMKDAALHPRLLDSVRTLVASGAEERAAWIRRNLRSLMTASGYDAVAISALSGVSATTVRAFVSGTDSSVTNVLRMAIALGVSLADLEQPPDIFEASHGGWLRRGNDGSAA